jgi:fatty acid desaturase
MIVMFYVAQVAAAMGAGYWLLQQPLSPLTGLGVAAAMLFIGTRLRGLNNIVHECSHFTFSQRREDNVVFGSICASLVLGCFQDYRRKHMTHHAHLGDYDKDLDLQGIRAFRLEEPLTPRTLVRHILTPIVALHLPHYLSIDLSGTDGRIYRVLKIGLIAAAVAALAFDPLAAVLLIWVPFLWIYSAINYWTDCVDHAGLVESGEELTSSRNVLMPKQLSAILFPRNDCYHLVHHLFPHVPARHLEDCHKQLMGNRQYRERIVEGPAVAPRNEAALDAVN